MYKIWRVDGGASFFSFFVFFVTHTHTQPLDLLFWIFDIVEMVGTPAESPRRRSARLIAEEAEKEKQARLKRYNLPDDGHLDFEKRTEKIRGFDVTRTILVRTTDSVKSDVGDWARKAFYQNNVFYPGQIVRAMLPYPQSDLEARYNPPHGEIAMMKAGPVGCKMRFMVILWTTNYGMFGLP